MTSTWAISHDGVSRKLTNPGGATSTEATASSTARCLAMTPAASRGLMRAERASRRARLEA